MRTKHIYPSINLFGLDFFQGSVESCAKYLKQQMSLETLITVSTPNPEQIVLAEKCGSFRQTLEQFDVFIPDGVGMKLASWLLKKGSLPRITGIDLAREFLLDNQEERKILIIGGRDYDHYTSSLPYQIERVFELTKVSPHHDVFWTEGYQNFKNKKLKIKDDLFVQSVIHTLQPDIIFIALGAPQQEEWVIEQREFLESQGVKLAMVVGGAFDTLLGKIPRAPEIVLQFGFEWLYRLFKQPWRWRRQLALITFSLMVVREVSK